jgi:hypothetical protein
MNLRFQDRLSCAFCFENDTWVDSLMGEMPKSLHQIVIESKSITFGQLLRASFCRVSTDHLRPSRHRIRHAKGSLSLPYHWRAKGGTSPIERRGLGSLAD